MNALLPMSKIGIIFLTWRRHLQKQIRPYGITLKQHYVLQRLRRYESLSPSRIADMLYCDRPTATYILGIMKRNGWIDSQKDPANRKQRLIHLTEAGLQKLCSLPSPSPETVIDPLACFTQAERARFETLLEKLYHHVKFLNEDQNHLPRTLSEKEHPHE